MTPEAKAQMQKILDDAVPRVIAQGGLSIDDEKTCLYRSPDGKGCVFGVLMPDTLDFVQFNSDAIYMDKPLGALRKSGYGFSRIPTTTLMDLQSCHDTASHMDDFKSAIGEFCKEHQLTNPIPEQAS